MITPDSLPCYRYQDGAIVACPDRGDRFLEALPPTQSEPLTLDWDRMELQVRVRTRVLERRLVDTPTGVRIGLYLPHGEPLEPRHLMDLERHIGWWGR